MQTIVFKGKKVAFRVQGEGAPLVLLHGLCEDSTIWDDFSEDLPDFKVILIDLFGFGQSECLPNNSIDAMAESVKAVLDHLQVAQAVVVGHSMGGYVATAFCKLYPQATLGLGLFHSHPFDDSPEKKAERYKAIEFIERNGHILYVKQLIPKLFAHLFATSNEFLMNSLIFKASKYTAETIIEAQKAMIHRGDQSDVVRQAKCPVLFIIGKQDTTVPYDMSLPQTILPTVADVHILPKVAHMGIFTAKDETVKAVRQFVHLSQLLSA